MLQAQEKIKFILCSKSVYVWEIQALTGLLNFITRVVCPGRAFLWCLYDSIANQNPEHHVNVTASIKKDLRAWMSFLTDFECYRPFPSKYTDDSDSLHFYTDPTAKVGLGFSCYFDGEWTFGQWDSEFLNSEPSIALLELIPIVIAMEIWGNHIQNNWSCYFLTTRQQWPWSINRPHIAHTAWHWYVS